MIASPGRSPRPARPATCVSSWKRPLAGAEIREAEPDVGGDHADQRHLREIVALRDHLRADQDVDLAAGDLLENLDETALSPHRVAIDARDAGRRKQLPDLGFDALGAEPDALHVRRRAFLAGLRDRLREVAVVTARRSIQPPSLRRFGETGCGPSSEMLQFGHSSVAVHCRQTTAVANPRRFSRISDCSPRSSRSCIAVDERPAQHHVVDPPPPSPRAC